MKTTVRISGMLTALFLLIFISASQVHGEEYNKIISQKYDVKPGALLKIDNRFGDVVCNNWDKMTIEIEVIITVHSSTQEKANNEELLRRLSGAPREKRKARYRCCVSYLKTPDSVPMNFEGVCTGHILEEPEGDAGFGYDPIFWSDDLDMSFGKASPEDKHAVSHRGRAFRAFAEWLMQQK